MKNPFSLAAIVSFLLLAFTSCSTGPNATRDTVIGAAGGAVVGGPAGAVVGGTAGNAYGHAEDRGR